MSRTQTGTRHTRDLGALAVLATAGALVLAWLSGCTSPAPVDPGPPIVYEGPCGTVLEAFNPLVQGLAPVGTDTTLDLATWNLEFFPLTLPGDYDCPHPTDTDRLDRVASLINQLDLDIVAVQEVSDRAGFQALLDRCPGYDGVLTPEDRGCNYQRVGFIYRTDQVTMRSARVLNLGDNYAFPRSPLEAQFTVTSNGRSYTLNVIVVHLKASGDNSSVNRRRAATALLKAYLDNEAVRDPRVNYMVAGDWNDRIDEPVGVSSFPAFIEDPDDYGFLTEPLAGKSEFASHSFGGGSLIDHLLINRAACADFSGARVTTLRLDVVVAGYNRISDHRPVMVQAPIFK